MIQPLDPSKELQAEAEDFALKRSKLSGQYPLTPSQQQRIKELQEKYKVCFEPRLSPPTERTPGESFKIEVEPGQLLFTEIIIAYLHSNWIFCEKCLLST